MSHHKHAAPRGRPRPTPARPTRRPWPLIVGAGAAVLVLALAVGMIALRGPTGRSSGAAKAASFSTTTDCRGFPQFTPGYGFTGGVVISTSLPERSGLTLLDPAQPDKGFQHPSWLRAGDLGSFAVDEAGNIYVGPAPRINTETNPPAGANTIWRVDTESAEMEPWLTLDAAREPSERNPFGILGLAFDCDTGTLYAASVAGSGPTSELGRLYQIDLAAQQVISQREGVDALGIVVAQTLEGRRLFYGEAREPVISSIALDERGAFVGEPRQEIDLAALGADVQEKARRIDFLSDGTLDVMVVPFSFTLAPKQPRHLYARYDGAAWVPAPGPSAIPAPTP